MNPSPTNADDPATGPTPRSPIATAYRRQPLPPFVDLRLDGNEGPVTCDVLRTALAEVDPEAARRYPSAEALERTLAAQFGVDATQVVVTAGADEALDRIFRAYGGSGRTAVFPEPTFEMIPRYAGLAGCEIVRVPWWDGPFPTDAFLARAPEDETAVLCVVSPNNPTGLVADAADVRRLAEARPRSLVVLDQAYIEYADTDPGPSLLDLGNVLIVRTLSKAHGVAGLRIGYAIGSRPCVDALRGTGSPYPVAGPSLVTAARVLAQGGARTRVHIDRVRQERDELRAVLSAHGLGVVASQANFVHAAGPRTAWLADALESLGILVRRFTDGRDTRLRITCPGEPESFARLLRGIGAALAPQALLFDVDGVLADVSASYRQAILATAHSFGVALAAEDIRALKAAGNANNDWELTRRAMALHGVDMDLASITERFEELYQGTPTRPGLRTHESVLVDPGAFQGLARALPLGVVTGRPRRDAERFLTEQGLAGACRAVVCMEDAELKPSPAPLRKALEALSVEHAWYFGDTPDDVVAARAAGVVPIGVTAPGDPPEEAQTSLLRAGAARVVASLRELPRDPRQIFTLLAIP
jgi:histidinol-phosphate aminotransferase